MIYFIQSGDGPIKIGYAKKSAINRMRELQVAHPTKLTLLGCIAGEVLDEKALHKKFAEFKLHGEWFTATDDILAHLAAADQIDPVAVEPEPVPPTIPEPAPVTGPERRAARRRQPVVQDVATQLLRQLTRKSVAALPRPTRPRYLW